MDLSERKILLIRLILRLSFGVLMTLFFLLGVANAWIIVEKKAESIQEFDKI